MASKKPNTKNQKDLDGLADTLASLIIKILFILICTAVLLSAYLFTRHSHQPTFNSLVVSQSSSQTIAVVDSFDTQYWNGDVRNYFVTYSFNVNGKNYSGVDKIPEARFNPANKSIVVKYYPNNPSINQLKDSYNQPALVAIRLIGAISCTLSVLVFISFFSNIKLSSWILIGLFLIFLISLTLSGFLAPSDYRPSKVSILTHSGFR